MKFIAFRIIFLFIAVCCISTSLFSQSNEDSIVSKKSLLNFKQDFLTLDNNLIENKFKTVQPTNNLKKEVSISLATAYTLLQLTQNNTYNNLWERQQRAIENYNPPINFMGKVED